MSIFDRFRINTYNFPQIENKSAHSKLIASMAVRIAAATYAFTNASDVSVDTISIAKNEPKIPFRTLRRILASGEGSSRTEWFGPEGGAETFVVSVVGGAAYGVLVGDTIFIGFRGTANSADWSINLFGLGLGGPLRIPAMTNYHHRMMEFGVVHCDKHDATIHAGFYRVAQALRKPINFELSKLQDVHKGRSGRSWNGSVILCGHSLGGALALAVGMHLNHAHEAVYTFGMPRLSGAGLLAELPANHYRYVLEGDPVPKLPFGAQGFYHDMPSICLDPYRGLQKPGWLAKAIKGLASGKTWSGAAGAAAKAIFASEHDMELYADTVMAQ